MGTYVIVTIFVTKTGTKVGSQAERGEGRGSRKKRVVSVIEGRRTYQESGSRGP